MSDDRTFRPPSPEAVARVRELAERPLDDGAYEARANRVIPRDELEEMWALIDWFTRRYPTVRERLEFARRMAETWRKAMPPSA